MIEPGIGTIIFALVRNLSIRLHGSHQIHLRNLHQLALLSSRVTQLSPRGGWGLQGLQQGTLTVAAVTESGLLALALRCLAASDLATR